MGGGGRIVRLVPHRLFGRGLVDWFKLLKHTHTMADSTTPPSGGVPPDDKGKRRVRLKFNKAQSKEVNLCTEIGLLAADPKYSALAGEKIDAAFVKMFQAKAEEASDYIAAATESTSGKQVVTQDEESLRESLVEWVALIQSRAKGKYKAPSAKRADYGIGEPFEASRDSLVTTARSIIKLLEKDPALIVKPTDRAQMQAALDAYVKVEVTQTDGQAKATGARYDLGVAVEELSEYRRQIQYAVDAVWPHRNKANAAIRIAFKLLPNRPAR